MTVVCHVDLLKMSHVDSFEITKFAGYMPCIYGGFIVHRGKVNYYLRIYLNYI